MTAAAAARKGSMSEQGQEIIQQGVPTCYRHPQRVTWVSCGRCGRPLCPDCMQHGPVGVRCAECLRPPTMALDGGAPEHVGLALGVGIGEAVCWCVVLVLSGLLGHTYMPFGSIRTFTPNLLLSGMAGGMVGWTIWRISGRAWNALTVWVAVLLGLLMPLLAAGLLTGLSMVLGELFDPMQAGIRALFTTLLSGLFAYLMIKRRR